MRQRSSPGGFTAAAGGEGTFRCGWEMAAHERRRGSSPLDHHFLFESALGTGVGLYHAPELAVRAAAGHSPTELEASRTALALRIRVRQQLALQRGVLIEEF